MSRSPIQKRKQARFLLIQALYQWLLSENPAKDVLLQFQLNPNFQQGDQEYFIEAFNAITTRAESFDKLYQPYLDRNLNELDPIEKSILRLGCFELTERLDVPYRVIINEGLELAKTFGATDSYKYINGVLDKLAKHCRSMET